jgi:hypothetical protein
MFPSWTMSALANEAPSTLRAAMAARMPPLAEVSLFMA